MSNSYQVRPWRALTGWAWWLLCQPSPPVRMATHQLLRESSLVSKRRLPQRWVAELTSHVACRPMVTRIERGTERELCEAGDDERQVVVLREPDVDTVAGEVGSVAAKECGLRV